MLNNSFNYELKKRGDQKDAPKEFHRDAVAQMKTESQGFQLSRSRDI